MIKYQVKEGLLGEECVFLHRMCSLTLECVLLGLIKYQVKEGLLGQVKPKRTHSRVREHILWYQVKEVLLGQVSPGT